MKTAVSLDDNLLREADETARQLGLSRSRLFAVALSEYLQRKRQEQMLRQLNEVYAQGPTPIEKRLIRQMKAKVRRIVERE
jgi:metal-responsive CopG/Arc/MetJ family transcriptional regulator